MSISIPPNTQSPLLTPLPADTFPGQKLEKNNPQESRPVVDSKQEVPAAKEDIPRDQVESAADKLNKLMGLVDKRLSFSVDDQSKQIVVKVVDQNTGEVLDQIPPKNIIDMLKAFKANVGLLVDKWA